MTSMVNFPFAYPSRAFPTAAKPPTQATTDLDVELQQRDVTLRLDGVKVDPCAKGRSEREGEGIRV